MHEPLTPAPARPPEIIHELRNLSVELDEAIKRLTATMSTDKRVYLNPNEIRIPLVACDAIFRLLGIRENIARLQVYPAGE
jgi:hypothetical protein